MENIILKVIETAYKIKNEPLLKKTESLDYPLTGEKLKFDAIDMCYLALELMAFYKISLEPEDLEGYNFNTIRSISSRIAKKL